MARKKERSNASRNNEYADEATIVPLLASGSYHLPGYTYCEDYNQYMKNNHILFGICFHHPLHPLSWWERILALLGSVSFGLLLTACAFLFDAVAFQQKGMNTVVLEVDGSYTSVITHQQQNDGYSVTSGSIILWTVGSVLNTIFDMSVWQIMACTCCHPGGKYARSKYAPYCKDVGSVLLLPVIGALVLISVLLLLKCASINASGQDPSTAVDEEFISFKLNGDLGGWKSFYFMIDYVIEIVLSWFIFYPVVGTILFTGILGCKGKVPILGGRPREMLLMEEGRSSSSNNSNKKKKKKTSKK